MNSKAVLGIAAGLGIAIIGSYVGYTRMQAQAAERADRLMRAELRCDGMKEDLLKLARFAFGTGVEIGGKHDTPENWKESETDVYPHMLKAGAEYHETPQAAQDVAHAMIPYARDLYIARSDEALWRIGREVCIQLEIKR